MPGAGTIGAAPGIRSGQVMVTPPLVTTPLTDDTTVAPLLTTSITWSGVPSIAVTVRVYPARPRIIPEYTIVAVRPDRVSDVMLVEMNEPADVRAAAVPDRAPVVAWQAWKANWTFEWPWPWP